MIKDKTLIVGATPNPTRYAFSAAEFLQRAKKEFIPISIKRGEVLGEPILDLREKPRLEGIHTITLYLNAKHQEEWEDYLLSLQPERIIFNPGAENPSLFKKALAQGIEPLNACTLVMISSGQY
ncbi:CoA-binding protein [Algoriphagus namhaensis]